MTPFEAHNECKRLEQVLRDKGYIGTEVCIYINFIRSGLAIKVERKPYDGALSKSDFFDVSPEEGFEPLIAKAEAFIADLESIVDARTKAFLKQVAQVIDAGRDIGIEVGFLNPLEDMMKKLSSNILTLHRA